MKIHLVRHGDAAAKQGGWSGDDARPLSRRGRAEARSVGMALRILGAEPDVVLTSPLARARQTAEEICAALGEGSSPVETAVLRPGATAGPIIDEIAVHHPGTIEVVCVGHMPDLGYVAAQLGTGPDCQPFRLRTGSLVRVDLDGRESRLIWLLSPHVVRQLVAGGEEPEV